MKQYITALILAYSLTLSGQSYKFKWAETFGSKSFNYIESSTIDKQDFIYQVFYIGNDTAYNTTTDQYRKHHFERAKGTHIIKLDTLGNLIWNRLITPQYISNALIQISPDNNIIVAGNFEDSLQIIKANDTLIYYSEGAADICLLSFDDKCTYRNGFTIRGKKSEKIFDLHVDKYGNRYLCGIFKGETNFHPDPNQNYKYTSRYNLDNGFILKLDKNNNIKWRRTLDQKQQITCRAICTDTENNCYVTGSFAGALTMRYGYGYKPAVSISDVDKKYIETFVIKLDSLGNHLWIKNYGQDGDDIVNDICVDSKYIYLAGGYKYPQNRYAIGVKPLDPSSYLPPSNHLPVYNDISGNIIRYRAVITKIDKTNGDEIWTKDFARINSYSTATSIVLNKEGNPTVVGYTCKNANMNTDSQGDKIYLNMHYAGIYNVGCGFAASLDTAGNTIWAKEVFSGYYFLSTQNLHETSPKIRLTPSLVIDSKNDIYCTNTANGIEKFETANDTLKLQCEASGYNIGIMKFEDCHPTYNTVYEELCYGYVNKYGRALYQPGSYTETLVGSNGCDSIVEHIFTIYEPSEYPLHQRTFACKEQGYKMPDNSIIYQDSTFIDALQTKRGGCDSIIRRHVVFYRTERTTQDTTVCIKNGFYIAEDDTLITESSTYTIHTTSINSGCDSFATWNIVVEPMYNIVKDTTICSDAYFVINDKKVTSSGIYTQYLGTKKSNCDSTITWNVTVNPTFQTEKDTTLYKGGDMTVAGEVFEFSQIFYQNLERSGTGCDSLIIWHITVSDSIIFEVNIPKSDCQETSFNIPYKILAGSPNQYKISFSEEAKAAGFTNIAYQNLHSNDRDGTISIEIPEGISEQNYTATIQMKSLNGTESAPIPFTFSNKLPATYLQFLYGDVVLINNSSKRFATYQWYKNGVLIEGATDQYYYDKKGLSGCYSVATVTNKGTTLHSCSKCYDEHQTDLQEAVIQPNPVKANEPSHLILKGYDIDDLKNFTLTIKDINGNVVLLKKISNISTPINLPTKDGFYIGLVSDKNTTKHYLKIINIHQ